jgi:transcription antitermination factor NusG
MGEACLDYENRSAASLPNANLTAICSQALSWYALKVRTGGELSSMAALRARGYDPYCPTRKERRRYSDRMKAVDAAVFPGYLFCKFDAQKKVPILSTPGIEYIVGVAGAPVPLTDQEVDSIRRVVDAGGTATKYLTRGQRVRVTHGALEGVDLMRDSDGDRLVVSINLLTRSASLQIDPDSVRPVEYD